MAPSTSHACSSDDLWVNERADEEWAQNLWSRVHVFLFVKPEREEGDQHAGLKPLPSKTAWRKKKRLGLLKLRTKNDKGAQTNMGGSSMRQPNTENGKRQCSQRR